MICRYCGYELSSFAQELRSDNGSKCKGNPNGKHVGISDGKCCIFCGLQVKPFNGKLRTSNGDNCPNSQTKMHCLQ